MKKFELRKLQNHFDNGTKEGFQAKIHYSVGDRVHLKGTNINGVVTAVIFKEDRSYPYLKIKWDTTPAIPEKIKSSYNPFDIVKEIKLKHKEEKKKKIYKNFYLEMRNE